MSGVCAVLGDISPNIWTLTPVRPFGPVGVIRNLQFDPPGTVSVLGETVRVHFTLLAAAVRTVLTGGVRVGAVGSLHAATNSAAATILAAAVLRLKYSVLITFSSRGK